MAFRPAPALSGITWTHTNGRSPEMYLPEPSGAVERFTDLPLDRYITIVEGQGITK